VALGISCQPSLKSIVWVMLGFHTGLGSDSVSYRQIQGKCVLSGGLNSDCRKFL